MGGKAGKALRILMRAFLAERDGLECWVCHQELTLDGASFATLDHVLPVSRGGTDDPGNLKLACPACNLERGVQSDDLSRDKQLQRAFRKALRMAPPPGSQVK